MFIDLQITLSSYLDIEFTHHNLGKYKNFGSSMTSSHHSHPYLKKMDIIWFINMAHLRATCSSNDHKSQSRYGWSNVYTDSKQLLSWMIDANKTVDYVIGIFHVFTCALLRETKKMCYSQDRVHPNCQVQQTGHQSWYHIPLLGSFSSTGKCPSKIWINWP